MQEMFLSRQDNNFTLCE